MTTHCAVDANPRQLQGGCLAVRGGAGRDCFGSGRKLCKLDSGAHTTGRPWGHLVETYRRCRHRHTMGEIDDLFKVVTSTV